MKKTFILFFILVSFVSICFHTACFAQEELKNYTNDLYAFKFNPDLWNIASDQDTSRTVNLTFKTVENNMMLDPLTGIMFQADKGDNPLDIKVIKDGIKGFIEMAWKNVTIVSVNDLQNNGSKGVEAIFVSDALNIKYKVMQYIFRKQENNYMITAVAKESDFDKAKPLFEAIVKTYVVK